MPAVPQRNEFNLVQNAQAQADKLQKMRKKLAGGSLDPVNKPDAALHRRRRAGGKTYKWALLAGLVLVGLNFGLRSQKDRILEALGMEVLVKPLAPPTGLEQDEIARFWAYAAFDEAKLRAHFPIPKNALVDPVDARHHLEDVLSRGNLGEVARAEVASLRPSGTKDAIK